MHDALDDFAHPQPLAQQRGQPDAEMPAADPQHGGAGTSAQVRPVPPVRLARDYPEKSLKHLDWFDGITHDELFDLGTNTMTDIPAPLQSEYAEAKKAVLQVLSQPEHANPSSVHA